MDQNPFWWTNVYSPPKQLKHQGGHLYREYGDTGVDENLGENCYVNRKKELCECQINGKANIYKERLGRKKKGEDEDNAKKAQASSSLKIMII